MSAFFNKENDIAEEEESNTESSQRVRDSKMYQRHGLDEVDEARLRSCLEEIRNVIGDSVPEQILIDTVLQNEFNLDKALDAVLSNAASAMEEPPAGEFCAVLLRNGVAFARVVTYRYRINPFLFCQ
jgi:elongation factor 1 alpha-like protein